MENSNIGWTDHTLNFWWGCHRVSEGCALCYIEGLMKFAGLRPFGGPIRTSPQNWRKALAWNRRAEAARIRQRVFTCSMSDFFHPGADDWREEAWDVIRLCHNLDWLVLTKRPELIAERLPADWGDGWQNVWLGTTVENRKRITRVPILAEIPARIRFISAEPLLGPINFRPFLDKIDWIITGCESGNRERRRPMDLAWVRDIDSQCRETHTAHFLKQYYDGTTLRYDGLLDGNLRKSWPRQFRSVSPPRSGIGTTAAVKANETRGPLGRTIAAIKAAATRGNWPAAKRESRIAEAIRAHNS